MKSCHVTLLTLTLGLLLVACNSKSETAKSLMAAVPGANADSMGTLPSNVKRISTDAPRTLKENSAAEITIGQPGIVFTINDSGNEPELFALDTTGASRGVWKVAGAENVDWEAMSAGPCGQNAVRFSPKADCLYIADVGDNAAIRPHVTLYRVTEPLARRGTGGTVPAERLVFKYPDGAHDVEAIYTTTRGDTYLITKRKLKDEQGRLRPSLVFVVPVTAWHAPTDAVPLPAPFIASLIDSLPVYPGSARLREITDASLSHDSWYLAVRTYSQVYVFATDTITGRVNGAIQPAVCNIEDVERVHGEGITWVGEHHELLLDSEGRDTPMHRITCPLPQR